jgi:TRAP-type C4-dicarboxylate transport system permease small subunit
MQAPRAVNNWLERASLTLAAIFLSGLTAVVFLEVIARYAFRYSFIWSEEAAIFCFQWITFLGAGVALRRDEHFRVDVLTGQLKRGGVPERLRNILVQVAVLLFVIVLVVYGTQFALMSLKRYSYALGIPIVHVTSAIPLAGMVMVLFAVERLLSSILGTHHES